MYPLLLSKTRSSPLLVWSHISLHISSELSHSASTKLYLSLSLPLVMAFIKNHQLSPPTHKFALNSPVPFWYYPLHVIVINFTSRQLLTLSFLSLQTLSHLLHLILRPL
jgi:hypothetical protein